MQVFVPYPDPISVARCLDYRRLNKQIVECSQILDVLLYNKPSKWKNHPIVKMYAPFKGWLSAYTQCLDCFRNGWEEVAVCFSDLADMMRPPFLTEEFCDQHKRRLYTKDPNYYQEFKSWGSSEENWYFLDNHIVKYSRGKLINE